MQTLSVIVKYFDYEMYIYETKNVLVENSTGKGIDYRQSKRSYDNENKILCLVSKQRKQKWV